MHEQSTRRIPKVLSYPGLRRSGGYIGVALPFLLVVGDKLRHGHWLEDSISAYYYTDMRNILVGGLCAIAIFLISCRGYELSDAIAGNLAGMFAVIVAFFPTTPTQETRAQCWKDLPSWVGNVHYIFAVLLFLILTYFCLVLFRKTGPDGPTPRKLLRNGVYVVCGSVMLACIVLGGITALPFIKTSLHWETRLFWFESVAVIFFGVAWLTKGEKILSDRSTPAFTEDRSREPEAR